MQRKANILSLIVAATFAASLALPSSAAQAGGKGIVAAATGSGQLTTPSGSWRTFSFTALTNGSGATSGHGQIHSHASGARLYLDILCLHVAGNVATVSGIVSDGNRPEVGLDFMFQVRDNGEGAKATGPDMISPPIFDGGISDLCASVPDGFDFGLGPIEAGNIQVH